MDATAPAPGKPVRFTWKRTLSMRRKADFDALRTSGQSFRSPCAVLSFAPASAFLCGIICSKKYSLLAVDRNRARRLIREALRTLLTEPRPKVHMAVIARKKLMTASLEQLRGELAGLLVKSGLISTLAEPERQSLSER